MTENSGVIYAAIGKQYLHMAVASARSLKAQCPSIEIDVFTDQATDDPVFDQVHELPEGIRFAKIPSMLRSRFVRTLFIDADTWIVADISDIFQILDHFDIAAAHDQYRNFDSTHAPFRASIPNAFPQLNTGVLAFKKSNAIVNLIENWHQLLIDTKAARDQPVFRELLYLSDLRIGTLPEEYNLMKYDVAARWTEEQCVPRIIHHRNPERHNSSRVAKLDALSDIVGPQLAEHIEQLRTIDLQFSDAQGPKSIHPLDNFPVVMASTDNRAVPLKTKIFHAVRAFVNQKR